MTILTIQPDGTAGKDTYIYGNDFTLNHGTKTTFITCQLSNDPAKALIQFNLSSIPAAAVIRSAVLSIYCLSEQSTSNRTVEARRSLVEWFEGSQSDSAPTAGQDGSTWNLRNANGSVAWAGGAGGAAGSDYSSSVTASVSITDPLAWYDLDLTADVQDFVDGTLTNYGWWLVGNVVFSNSGKTFASSDYTIDSTLRPKLVIDYYIPSGAVLQPDATQGKDTYIHSGSPTFNYGTSTTLVTTGGSPTRRSFVQFDLSGIPANSHIVSATLTLTNIASSGSPSTTVNRITSEWFEGSQNGAAPSGGQDGSTWNLRNANGSVAYNAGAGGDIGTQIATRSSGSFVAGGANDFDVTDEVQNIVDGTITNNGWSIITSGTVFAFTWASSDHATAASRPKLTITYESRMYVSDSGSVTVTGTLMATGYMEGTSAGTSADNATLKTNLFSFASSAGLATASGTLVAKGYMLGNSFGDSVAVADIKASYHSVGLAAGQSSHVADIKGVFRMQGTAAGVGLLVAVPSFEGQMRGSISGAAITQATGYARAVSKASAVGCNTLPLFYLTDGSIRPNGQLNLLNFLSERYGFIVKGYRPQIPQYKEGGRFSNSPQSQGRRLRYRTFDNAIDVIEFAVPSHSQDNLIQFQQELIAYQEAAADYWISEFTLLPIYLVARAARETNTRYAIVHMISVPELENPYAQPFFDTYGAAFENLTVRIERGLWTSTPPGFFDCVEISSQKEWTVSGWTTSS